MQKLLTSSRHARIMADMKPLSQMLNEWRTTLRLSPAEAARRCDMSRQQWSDLEDGTTSDPRASTLLKLHDGTGIPLERLAEAARAERLVGATA